MRPPTVIIPCLLALLFPALTQAQAQTSLPTEVLSTPQVTPVVDLPRVNAKAWLLYDLETGKVLAKENEDVKLPPASVTKIMTAYVTLRAIKEGKIKWEDKLRVPPAVNHLGRDESKVYLFPRDQVKVRDLFGALIIASANDAAMTLAEGIGGSQKGFIDLMNSTAREIGMKDSNWATPSGMTHPDNYTSARDLALLAAKMTEEFPIFYEFSKQTSFAFKRFRRHRSSISRYDSVADGLKNGYTSDSGYCTVASTTRPSTTVPSTQRRLFAIVLGAPTKNERTKGVKALLKYGFAKPVALEKPSESPIQTISAKESAPATPPSRNPAQGSSQP